jgi:hypothetical protein
LFVNGSIIGRAGLRKRAERSNQSRSGSYPERVSTRLPVHVQILIGYEIAAVARVAR